MKKILLIILCTLLIFSCKKDDDGTTDPNGGGNGGGNKNPENVSCSYDEYKTMNANGDVTFGFKYHYTGNVLDSATPLGPNAASLYTLVYTYLDGGKRRTDYYYSGVKYDAYEIETFNEYGDIATNDAYDQNGNPVSSIINEYYCGFTSAVSGRKYCQRSKSSYLERSTNVTTVTNYYYTENKLDSTVSNNGSKMVYEYIDDNTRKAVNYVNGVPSEGYYTIQTLNEYGKTTEIKSYKNGVYNGSTTYSYKCD